MNLNESKSTAGFKKNLKSLFEKSLIYPECADLSWASSEYESFEEIPLINKYYQFENWKKYFEEKLIFDNWIIIANFIYFFAQIEARKKNNLLCITFTPDLEDNNPPIPHFFICKKEIFENILKKNKNSFATSHELNYIKKHFEECGFMNFKFIENIWQDEWGKNHRIYALPMCYISDDHKVSF